MKAQAAAGKISYYELGAIGQHGIVNGSISGTSYNNQYRASALGTIFRDGKFAFNRIDHSDSATYWTLMGDYGVSLSDVRSDGSNNATIEQRNEDKFKAKAPDLMAELLDRVTIAAGQ